MESIGDFNFSDMNQTKIRKKRSHRRPPPPPRNGNSSFSSSPPSTNGSELTPNQETSDDKSQVFASNYQEPISDGHNSDAAKGVRHNVVKKVKLKLGGVIRTIHTNSSTHSAAKEKLISQLRYTAAIFIFFICLISLSINDLVEFCITVD